MSRNVSHRVHGERVSSRPVDPAAQQKLDPTDPSPSGEPVRRLRRLRRPRREELKKGVYILPNLLTTGGMASGFYAIINAIDGNYVQAAWFIVLAAIFDLFDGRVARMTRTTSAFGVQYDSLADLAAFGLAPAVVLYLWALRDFGQTGWLAAFLYFVCGALRLARFNVQAATPGPAKKHFTGLPIPIAAMTVAATLILHTYLRGNVEVHHFSVLVLAFSLAFLMVSTIPYRSFKQIDLKGGRSFQALVCFIIVILLVLSNPPVMVFVFALTYVAHGPLETLIRTGARARRAALGHPAPRREDV